MTTTSGALWKVWRKGWRTLAVLGFVFLGFVFLGFAVVGLAGGCDDGGLMTKGTFCSRMGGPECERAIACGIGPNANRQACVEAFVRGCCENSHTCGERASDAGEQMVLEGIISECSAALPTWDCAQYAAGTPPPECGGSAASPLSSSPASPPSPPAGAASAASTGALGVQAGRKFSASP